MTVQFLQTSYCSHWRGWLLCRAQFLPQPNIILLAKQYDIVLPPQIEKSVAKRQTEYLAGRLLLRQMQQQLGLASMQILPGDDRSPQWPDGQQGSLSHTASDVFAGLSQKTDYRLGLDIELWLSPAQCRELSPMILSSTERDWCVQFLASQSGSLIFTESQLFTLIFAAKEALYKALYPDCRLIMEFSAAAVQLVTANQILMALTCDWSPHWRVGSELWLDYQIEPDLVQVQTEVQSQCG
ncbi:MAG: 4'-phosphopantetheinyl transferase superfamily protein [Gammaproteobacteria bacterium]|jgi:enterobactin synthetase component D|nr:4'-phosphopantetheinyl transferase superfamily protein [Gammaproteobacteria bacterium]